MALHLIVDGYNLMCLRPRFWEQWGPERDRLIRRLTDYTRTKGHRATVVFDGWRSDHQTEHEERAGRLIIIYSRQGQKADDVIARLAREHGKAGVVVSSDRAVMQAAVAAGGVALRASEFEARLNHSALLQATAGGQKAKDAVPVRPITRSKRGNPKRLAKGDRMKHRRLVVL